MIWFSAALLISDKIGKNW